MRAIVTLGVDFPEDARDELEAHDNGDSQITSEGMRAMIQKATDVTVIELELVD